MPHLPPEIFKTYDIRGIVGTSLTADILALIGQALGSEARAVGATEIVIGHDGRLSSPTLASALAGGIQAAGMDIVDLGMVTTPMAYFAAHHLASHAAAIITGSHNPPEYNGLKLVLGGETLAEERIQALRQRILQGNLDHGVGRARQYDIAVDYLRRVTGDVKLARPMNIIIDCGNGVAGAYAPALFRQLGCEVEEMYCEVDGRFPNHHPDPSQPHNLKDLIARLARSSAEIGLAFDGDGDRLGVVTRDGRIIYPDRLLMLLAADVLARNPGAQIIFDVKSTRNLYQWITARGGRPLLWKTGHSLLKAKMRETGALLAGEMSGHIFFKDRWYGFDDGMYTAARLLECLSRQADGNATLHGLPDALSTPELHIPMREGEAQQVIARLRVKARFVDARRIIDIDGLRVEYDDGFGLVRASNTMPAIVLRFEADNTAALERIHTVFRTMLLEAEPGLSLPF